VLPEPLATMRGATSKGKGEEGRKYGGRKGRGRENRPFSGLQHPTQFGLVIPSYM